MGVGTEANGFQPSWLERCAVQVLRVGPMSKHIAIILDGNRRFARNRKLEKVIHGHQRGADKLDDLVDILLLMGVEELTLYVFSIENFKRAEEEVNGIMTLMLEKLKINELHLKERGLCYEFIGNLEQTPDSSLHRQIQQCMILSRENRKLKVNFAFIYTGRNEITQGVNKLLLGLHQGKIQTDELTPKLLQDTFTLHPSNPVDVLIRTSGECRLSDFLTWQSTHAHIEFVEGTWPEFTFWGLALVIFRYQSRVRASSKFKTRSGDVTSEKDEFSENAANFVEFLRNDRWNEFKSGIIN